MSVCSQAAKRPLGHASPDDEQICPMFADGARNTVNESDVFHDLQRSIDTSRRTIVLEVVTSLLDQEPVGSICRAARESRINPRDRMHNM